MLGELWMVEIRTLPGVTRMAMTRMMMMLTMMMSTPVMPTRNPRSMSLLPPIVPRLRASLE
jgi:hypothetical protein